MNRTAIYIFSLLLSATSAVAQAPKFAEWEENPKLHVIPVEYLKEPAVIVLQDVKLDYRYDGDYLVTFRTVHKIVRILDDKGIEMFNKVEIPVTHGRKILSVKARTILPDGKTYEITRDKIKRTQNEHGGAEYLFAMEGVEKNSEIEYVEKEMTWASFYGSETFQYSIPVMNTFFEMDCPKEITFEEKGYHGFPNVKDSVTGHRRHIKVYQPDIAALRDEPFSFSNLYKMRVEYKINNYKSFHDGGEGWNNENPWDDHANDIYNDFCKISDSEKRSVNNFLSTIGVNGGESELEKLRKIENGIKTNIVLYSENDDVNDRIDSMILKKTASEDGMVKLFAACFKMAGVKYELGITSSKYYHQLNPKFQNLAMMSDYVFWFPSFDHYLSPADVYLRYPMIPVSITNNKGIFCKVDEVGDVYKGLSDIRTIEMFPTSENQTKVATEVSFNEDMEPVANTVYSFTGYPSCYLRTQLAVVPEDKEKKKDIVHSVVTIADKPEDILGYSFTGAGVDNYFNNKPITLTALVKLPLLMDKGDNNSYLLHVGDLLGNQPQLYEEKDRALPVDLNYPEIETNTITINIPKDCKVENLEALKMKMEYPDEKGNVNTGFWSDYKMDSNKLVITTKQLYSKTHFSVSDYPFFRSVINTAADFNKITIYISRTKKKIHTKTLHHKTNKIATKAKPNI